MDIHASPASLPELDAFLAPCQVRGRRPEGEAAWERSLPGLRTARPNKPGATLAEAVPGPSAPRWPALRTTMPWDAPALNRQRVEQRSAAAPVGQGGRRVDAPGGAKQGQAAVGGARPAAGTRGQGGHCPGAGPCGSSDPHARGPVAVRVSLPQAWTEAPERCLQARGPADVTFQPTPESALALLAQARAWGVPHRGGGAAAAAGDTPHGVAGLATRHAREGVAVRSAVQGRPPWREAPPAQRGDQGWSAVPRRPGRPGRWRHGAKGW